MTSSKNEHAIVLQLGSDQSLDTQITNGFDRSITISKPTQPACDSASSKVVRSQVDLIDYTDSVFELGDNLPLANKEKPPINILVEISQDLAFV